MHEIYAERIGKDLVEKKLLATPDFDQILQKMQRGIPFDELILKQDSINEKEYYSSLANVSNIPFVDLSDYRTDTSLVNLVPARLAKKYILFPLFKLRDSLAVAMIDPFNMDALDRLREHMKIEIDPVIAARSEINNLIERHYGAGHSMDELVDTLRQDEARKPVQDTMSQIVETDQPVVKLLNLMIEHAVKQRASDIHIEPDIQTLRVRLRIDGILQEVSAPPKRLESAIISRAKILADLNIAENRVPQDGRFSMVVDEKKIDIRVSIIPTVNGENVVFRILDSGTLRIGLQELGFSKEVNEKIEYMLGKPHGMILVTGPTGSGKTTTLYTVLQKLNTKQKHIMTIEDPVEYRLELIRQIQVNPKVGLTFANGLRSIVRQDPDIIFVGEIRDLETAQIAIQSALTGHLVLSTLHTNDASGAAIRLVDMGVEPFLVASSVIGIIAQRLVRLNCPKCKKPEKISDSLLDHFNVKGHSFFKGEGCSACSHTGHKGRAGIGEALLLNEKVRELIVSKAPSHEIKAAAVAGGMKSMLEDGLEKAKQGLTSLTEVLRVAQTID